MVTITLKDGFSFDAEDGLTDDWELIEAVSELEENAAGVIQVLKRILGSDQYKKLKEHIRKDGKVSASRMVAILQEIFESEALKNLAS